MKTVNRKRRYGNELERLERRDLLAGDLAPGDANADYFVDDSDLVLAFQAGKFETDDDATFAEGDWTDDGKFTSHDFVVMFQEGLYYNGPYDDSATDPVHSLSPISTEGEADTTIYFQPTTGSIAVSSESGKLTTVQLNSASGGFIPGKMAGLFDVRIESRIFHLDPGGNETIVISNALPPGLSEFAIRSDLTVDGSALDGGNLGNVRLELVDTLPEGQNVEGHNDTPRGDGGGNNNGGGRGNDNRKPSDYRNGDGLAPGDANGDFRFDESDFILAMKSGKYETEQPASWQEGDWNEDDVFNSSDFVQSFIHGLYRRGVYDDHVADPINELAPFSTVGVADTTFYYDSASGSVVIVPSEKINSYNIVSASGQLNPNVRHDGLFDVATETSNFELEPNGTTEVQLPTLLPAGLTLDQIRADLVVDGSAFAGGGLGIVHLDSAANLPEGIDVDTELNNGGNNGGNPGGNNGGNQGGNQAPRPSRGLVDISEANGLITYNPENGDFTISGIDDVEITTVEIISQAGNFTGTETNNFEVGLFDVAITTKLFWLRPEGVSVIELEGFAEPGLTVDELKTDLTGTGSIAGGGRLNLALAMAPEAIVPEVRSCEAYLADGFQQGDANADGVFNSLDLVTVFQAGMYEDGVTGGTQWHQGDWNCDGEFNSTDFVAAFSNSRYEENVAAALADSQTEATDDRVDIQVADQLEHEFRKEARVVELEFGSLDHSQRFQELADRIVAIDDLMEQQSEHDLKI